MTRSIVEVHFPYQFSEQELHEKADQFTPFMMNIPGLVWKIWIYNGEKKITGGIYHFDSKESARNYINGPIFEEVKKTFTHIDYEIFDLLERPSRATNAPVFA